MYARPRHEPVHLCAGGRGLNEDRNFESFTNAMLLLFQVLTGDAWSGLMADAMLDEGSGKCAGETCGSWVAVPYFISFQVLGSFVFLNLVVAVILENFTSLGQVNPDLVSTNDIEEFKEMWGWYDPDADGMIPAKKLPDLVLALPPPLGIKGTKEGTSASKAFRFCLSLGLTQKDGEVGFKQVLDALINKNYKKKEVDVSAGGESPPAVREVLLMRQKTLGAIDISKVTPGGLNAPLTDRRFEMSRILAEELLRMFIPEEAAGLAREPAPAPVQPGRRRRAAAKGRQGGHRHASGRQGGQGPSRPPSPRAARAAASQRGARAVSRRDAAAHDAAVGE